MSLHIEFEPHSWYMGFAIQKDKEPNSDTPRTIWRAYTDNGMTYRVDTEEAYTLSLLKQQIREHRQRQEERTREIYRRLEEDR